jgi:glutamate-1-semialdehyde aminotransferase
VFKAYGHEIAAFLIEPIMGNCCSISATREYLRDAACALRSLRHPDGRRRGQDRFPRRAAAACRS